MKKLLKNQFLFEELIKRDFKKKYKRTTLGMLWSVLSPLLNVLVLMVVFTQFFGREQAHFIIYIFSGTLVMSFFTETTQGCMRSLMANASIFTKINVPKYLFMFSKAIQAFVNFLLTFGLYIIFCIIDHIDFGIHMLSIIYPILCLLIFSMGVGMILAAMFVFFRDIEYLYGVFLTLLNYVSAIFYPVEMLPQAYQSIFLLNPLYVYIRYFRCVMIDGQIPSLGFHVLCAIYAGIALAVGCFIYKKYNNEFLYYV